MSGDAGNGDVAGGDAAGGDVGRSAPGGGYALGGFADRERELSRLELQARRLVGMHEGAYRRAGLLDAPFVLDVGAGSGAPARFLRDAGVETLCVDVDRSDAATSNLKALDAATHALFFEFQISSRTGCRSMF